MTVNVNPGVIVEKIAETLVITQKFANKEAALWDIALTAVRNRVAYYQRRIRRLENKYNTDFDTFSVQITGTATPAEEDDWLAWRSARSMLADWQQTYQELLDERST